ncbi:MAG: class E sortase [Mycobacteriales bacterium]|nr:class E sortase [Frankia sp.]
MLLAKTLRGLGQTLITAGVVILLFVGYELWFTDLKTSRDQRALGDQIEQVWRAPPRVHSLAIGDGIAVIHIPRFGRNWQRVVVEGVTVEALKKGPGHYPGTQLPGEIGNFVVSGHRVTYGHPFNQIDTLRPGDPIVIETRDTWFTYVMESHEIVRPTAIEVAYPVPHHPEAVATKAILTMTSCHPKYSARLRFIVHATLESTLAKSAGDPAALTGVT